MRGILTAYLAICFPGGLGGTPEDAAAHARFSKTTAKTKTAKTV